jgi:hypothetical protein
MMTSVEKYTPLPPAPVEAPVMDTPYCACNYILIFT